jgi:malate dehydrogenase
VSVIGADAVDGAASAGVLVVGVRDVVTPLARDRARERGVEIVVATPGASAAVIGDRTTAGGPPRVVLSGPPPEPIRPPSGALYRRGAPLPPGRRQRPVSP